MILLKSLLAIFAIGVVAISAIFAGLSTIPTVRLKSASSSFSPQEVWTYQGNELNSTVGSWSYENYWDVNSDKKAEIMLMIHNYSTSTFEIEMLNGADGSVLSTNVFSDVAYVENGDKAVLEPTLYGEMVTNATGTPVKAYNWVIFVNSSNNYRISIYKVDNITLENVTYKGIDIPSQLTYGFASGSVALDASQCSFHPIYENGNPYLLYIGYYVAPLSYGDYAIYEIKMILLDANLNTVWEKTEKTAGYSSFIPIGADVTSFNGWGLNGDTPDIVYVNLTASPGNTTLVAIDSINGNVLWTSLIEGAVLYLNPSSALSNPFIVQMDFNRDKRVDFGIETINVDNNETRAYFIKSDGTVMGYATLGAKKFGLYSLPTDYKGTLQFHTLFQTIDVNGDGKGEIFIVNNNTQFLCWDIQNNISLWSFTLENQSYHYMAYLSTNDINSDNVWDVYLIGANDTNDYEKKINLTAVDSTSGNAIWNKVYPHLIEGIPGMSVLKEISDLNGDGFQDAVVVDGYYNDGKVYVYADAISLRDGSTIWSEKVSSEIDNNDYSNWSAYAYFLGDINADGTNDVLIQLVYHPEINMVAHYWTYLRILSGADGAILWTGQVTDDFDSTDAISFLPLTIATGWNQFDYNDDNIENEIIIKTGFSIQIYAVTNPVPEMNFAVLAYILLFLPIVVAIRKRIL